MERILLLLLTIPILSLAPSCKVLRADPGLLKTDNLRGAVTRVIDRTSDWIEQRDNVSEEDRNAFADKAAQVRAMLEGPEVHYTQLAGPLMVICDRHDALVLVNASVDDYEYEVYLRTTTLIRRLMIEAAKDIIDPPEDQ